MVIEPQRVSNLSHEFLSLVEKYASHLERAGVRAKPTREPGLCRIFDALPAPSKATVLERLRDDLGMFQAAVHEGYQLKDSPRLLWRYLVKSGLVPSPDIFAKIENEDVVIVYDAQQMQVFQNLRFFELVSLTLEQVFCEHWYTYMKREEWVEKAIYEAGVSMATGQVRTTFDPGVPEHLAWEVNTERLLKLRLKVRWMSPVFSGDQIAGAIIINRCSLVE